MVKIALQNILETEQRLPHCIDCLAIHEIEQRSLHCIDCLAKHT